jgi:hypothetical protein
MAAMMKIGVKLEAAFTTSKSGASTVRAIMVYRYSTGNIQKKWKHINPSEIAANYAFLGGAICRYGTVGTFGW